VDQGIVDIVGAAYHLLSEPIVSNGGVLSIPTLTSFQIGGLKQSNAKKRKETLREPYIPASGEDPRMFEF
jgi:hypothetical protein